MHSFVDYCMCPDQGLNSNLGSLGIILQPSQPPSQGLRFILDSLLLHLLNLILQQGQVVLSILLPEYTLYPSLPFTSTLSKLPPPLPCHHKSLLTYLLFLHSSSEFPTEQLDDSAKTHITSSLKPSKGFPLCSGIDPNLLTWPASPGMTWILPSSLTSHSSTQMCQACSLLRHLQILFLCLEHPTCKYSELAPSCYSGHSAKLPLQQGFSSEHFTEVGISNISSYFFLYSSYHCTKLPSLCVYLLTVSPSSLRAGTSSISLTAVSLAFSKHCVLNKLSVKWITASPNLAACRT